MFNSLLLATSRGARVPRDSVQQNDFNREFFEHLRYKPSKSDPEVYTNNLPQRLARAHYELLFEFGGWEALMGSHATELNEEKLNDMFVVQERLEKKQTDAKEIVRQCAAELGISVGSSSALAALVFAELMQEAGNDMNLKRKYLDAIQVIGVNSKAPKDIQNALQTVNSNANVPNDVAKAYAYFGLYVDVSDQLLIARYGLKMMHDKAAIDQHRQQLQIIASFKKTDMLNKFIKTGTYKEKKKRKKTAAPVTPAKQRPIATAFPVLSQKQKPIPTAAAPVSSSKDKQGSTATPLLSAQRLARPKGLVNYGNICYMNSVLQYLYRVRLFRRITQSATVNNAFTRLLGATFQIMDDEDDFAFVAYPQELVTLALTTGAGDFNSQQDASECLMHILDMVAEGAGDAQLHNELLDNFAVFMLGASTPGTLAQKLDSWLEDNNKMGVIIPILNYSLDRLVLGHAAGAAGSNVSHAVVDFPLQINMQRYYAEHLHSYTPSFMYTLHTVIYHSGTDISGHYWSYILDHTTNQWWEFEDQKVQPVEENTVLHCSKSPDAHITFVSYILTDRIHDLVTGAIPNDIS
ncbi:hypothetical protein MUCCIDRAFT_114070 [Mucor lusitanicus CBS 277.49]|uniref:USP domain-containing protein n=1 Tax=Mucor lusitanicus CBS 277.49 TaxID=747725 RepID=A0A168J0A8_MUCCL|nr:hypothetical protein MUCCIDRAFT_114070 [Mucor lusitanicus CBS 277.49]